MRVAVIGAGPAGIYASDILSWSGLDVSIDLFERLPAPFGLVRYGVAPDHPRIKRSSPRCASARAWRHPLLGNVRVRRGHDPRRSARHYDAVIFATGAIRDSALDDPRDRRCPARYGAADFVSWYDGHPDVPRDWPLDAELGRRHRRGNVALDVARMLAKDADDLLRTEIPANVYQALKASAVTDVHVFARRGPGAGEVHAARAAGARRLADVDVVVYPEDFDFDEGSMAAIHSSNQTKQVVKTLTDWTLRDPAEMTAHRRIHLHFLHKPVAILGEDRVTGLRTERTVLDRRRVRRGTGQMRRLAGRGRVPGGRLLRLAAAGPAVRRRRRRDPQPARAGCVDAADERVPGVYATGWIKRGPVGLIGHTKSDAMETVRHLVDDAPALDRAPVRDPQAIVATLPERGVESPSSGPAGPSSTRTSRPSAPRTGASASRSCRARRCSRSCAACRRTESDAAESVPPPAQTSRRRNSRVRGSAGSPSTCSGGAPLVHAARRAGSTPRRRRAARSPSRGWRPASSCPRP